MKYLKRFSTEPDYQEFKCDVDWISPNLSVIDNNKIVKYNVKEFTINATINNTVENNNLNVIGDIFNLYFINNFIIDNKIYEPIRTYTFPEIKEYNYKIKIKEKAKDLTSLFSSCQSLTSIDLSNMKSKHITNMNNMFFNCKELMTINLNGWDVSNVVNMNGTFASSKKLTTINGIENWDCSNVTDLGAMFSTCEKLSSLNLQNWSPSKCKNMGSMFYACKNLKTLTLNKWNTNNATDLSYMFYGCINLSFLDTSFWNLSNATDISYMFSGCGMLTQIDTSGWNTINAKNMSGMFSTCANLININTYGLKTSSVTDMGGMFNYCPKLQGVYVGNFDTSSVTNMSSMFYYCQQLRTLNLTTWNIGKVTNMSYMFYACSNLTEVRMGGNPEKLTNITNMFGGVTTIGNFYYNRAHDYSKIIAVLPSTWTAIPCILSNGVLTPDYTNKTCTIINTITNSNAKEQYTIEFKDGMTWGEWINSDYNTINGYVYNTNIVTIKDSDGSLGHVFNNSTDDYYDYNYVRKNDKIVANKTYYINYWYCCFAEGTQVLVNFDGTTRNIEDIKIGDTVISYSTERNENYESIVHNNHMNTKATEMAKIICEDGTELVMTTYHPLYTKEGWKSLTNHNGYPTLTENDTLKTIDDWSPIKSIEMYTLEKPVTVYTLDVRDKDEIVDNDINDAFYANGVLAHNATSK